MKRPLISPVFYLMATACSWCSNNHVIRQLTPAHTDRWVAFIWVAGLTAVFAPLAVARYRNVAAK